MKAGSTVVATSATTNASGQYSLIIDTSATYNLKFSKSDYVEQTRENVNPAGSSMTLADIIMVAPPFAGGTGTSTDPYQISTPRHLDNVRKNSNANFVLKNDIDLADWGDWEPIGKGGGSGYFGGVFDGNGYVIKNMTVNVNGGQALYAGLIGYLWGTVKNVGMINSKVNATSNGIVYAGGIAGYSPDSTSVISNCYTTGEVNATSSGRIAHAGGIAGSSSRINNCYNTGKVSATNNNSDAFAGGIVGTVSYNTEFIFSIFDCYNTGEIKATGKFIAGAGGIAGQNLSTVATYKPHIVDCYNIGNIDAICSDVSRIGGILGYLAPSRSETLITNCYYLDSTVNVNNISALTSAQMKQQSSFVGFDFTNTWAINPAINNGYPYLRGMQP
jgi:hypothetical protein